MKCLLAIVAVLCIAGIASADEPASPPVAWYDAPGLGLEPSIVTPRNLLFYVVLPLLGIYYIRGGKTADLAAWVKSFFKAIPAPPPQLDFRNIAQPIRLYDPASSAPPPSPAAPEALDADTVLTLYQGKGRFVSPRAKTEFEATEPLEFRFDGRPPLRVVPQE